MLPLNGCSMAEDVSSFSFLRSFKSLLCYGLRRVSIKAVSKFRLEADQCLPMLPHLDSEKKHSSPEPPLDAKPVEFAA